MGPVWFGFRFFCFGTGFLKTGWTRAHSTEQKPWIFLSVFGSDPPKGSLKDLAKSLGPIHFPHLVCGTAVEDEHAGIEFLTGGGGAVP